MIGSRDQVDKGASKEQQDADPLERLRCWTVTHTMLIFPRNEQEPCYALLHPSSGSFLPFLGAPFPSYEPFIRLIRSSGFEGVGGNKKSISLGVPAANFLELR